MSDKKKSEKFTFPPAKGIHLALNRPDTKYNPLGTYKANLRMTVDEAAPVIERLQKIAEVLIGKRLPKKKNSLWYYELDKETEEETGYVIFRNEVPNKQLKNGDRWERRPLLIDAKMKPTKANPWGGSTLVVQSEFYVSKNADGKISLKLQPIVVQIIDLVTGDGNGVRGDLSAFQVHEGGFVGSDEDVDRDEDEEDDYASKSDNYSGDDDGDY